VPNNKNIKNILQFGFGTLLSLVFIFAVVSMYQIRQVNQNLTSVVEINNAKIELARDMRDAIHLRQINLNKMLATQDPFARNEELLLFYDSAGLYRQARTALMALPMNEQERQIHELLTESTRNSQPLNNRAAELIEQGADNQEIQAALTLAQTEQTNLLAFLTNLVSLQKHYAKQSVTKGRDKYDQTLLIVFVMSVPLLLGAFTLVQLVSRYLADKNQQLAEATQRALSATKEKSKFLATMSHEIRTPMTSIIGFSEFALDEDQSLAQRNKAITTILHSGKHLLQLLNGILDLSKIEAGRLQLEKIEFSPFQILSDVETFMRPQVQDKNLVFNLEHKFPLPRIVCSDPLRLKQILLNLCSNALKFTHTGSITLKTQFDSETNNLIFNVIDTGIGMSKEQISRVFNAFTQADSSTTKLYGGTGLGLTLSQQLAKALGGKISVKSYEGIGSQFSFSLLVDSAAASKLVEKVEDNLELSFISEATDEQHNLEGEILLAEDNDINQQLICYFITKMGAKVTVVNNGREAVNKAMANNYDLIFMDMQMPIMSGLDAIKILRKNNYKKPIITLTANATSDDESQCLAAGCNDFITKPIDREKLYRVTSNYLPKSQTTNSANESRHTLANKPIFTELVQKFVSHLPDSINNIKQLAKAKQWSEVKKITHQLKGMGGGLGFPVITEITKEIDIEIARANYLGAQNLIEQLDLVSHDILSKQSQEIQPKTKAKVFYLPTSKKQQ